MSTAMKPLRLMAGGGHWTVRDVAIALGLTERQAGNVLDYSTRAGRVEVVSGRAEGNRAVYAITEKGRTRMAFITKAKLREEARSRLEKQAASRVVLPLRCTAPNSVFALGSMGGTQ